MRRIILFSLCLGCCAVIASAAQDAPVIQVNTRLVPVDVVVRNGKGPVTGLTKDDFTLFDNGKRQEIALFKVTDARGPVPPAMPLAPGMVSNRLDSAGEAVRNTTAILVDHLNTPQDSQIYGDNQVMKFLRTAKKGDRIAIYLLSEGNLAVIQDFTTDMDRLIKAAARLNPEDAKINSLTQMMEDIGKMDKKMLKGLEKMALTVNENRAVETAQALTAIAKHLTGFPDRKNLVWISSGFPLGDDPSGRRGLVNNFQDRVEKSARFLNEANIAVYPVDPRGLTLGGLRTDDGNLVTMNTVARLTGGEVFFHTNDIAGAIREAIDDADVTYTLGFYPQEQILDGSFHELRVKVETSGLDVRFRKGYFASTEQAPTNKERVTALQEALASPLNATAVGLTASSQADPVHKGTYRLTALVNLNDLHLERQETAAGVVWTGMIAATFREESSKDPNFQVVDIPIKLSEDQFKAALRDGFAVHAAFDTAEPAGRVRVVVQDQTTGATGSVWIPLDGK